ncbi:MAG: hypothetical protein KIT57_21290 [Blastocatellales bacterium]|nr:hypothetical protein [Blastocatellales bacterium]
MKRRNGSKPGGRRRERGVALVITALGMSASLLAIGLVVDICHFYMIKTELQHAADAAALAGASALDSSSTGLQKAVTRAGQVLNKSGFNKNNVVVPAANVKFSINLDDSYVSKESAEASAANIRFVRVTTAPAPVNVFFASMVLGDTFNITATATAGQSVPLNVICGFIPVFVVDYGVPISPGNLYTFRASPNNSVSPGNYQILAAAGSGDKDVSEGLAGGVNSCAQSGVEYAIDTEPGVKAGPVRKGINTRFNDYSGTNMSPANYPPDTNIRDNITYAQYQAGSPSTAPNNPGVAGRRIVLIPIVKENEIDNGRNVVRFNRFGVFFLRSKVGNGNGGDLVAEYISAPITVSQGDYDPNGGPSNALIAVPVLYK